MSAVGPERRIAPPHDLGRERGIAEVDGQPSIAEGDARDPKPKYIELRLMPIIQSGLDDPRLANLGSGALELLAFNA